MDTFREWFYQWCSSAHYLTKLSLVWLVSTSLAVFAFATTAPNTSSTPILEPDLEEAPTAMVSTRPATRSVPRQVTTHKTGPSRAERVRAEQRARVQREIRCAWEKQAAEERYAALTQGNIDDIDTDAAVAAWRAWSEVEVRCGS